MAENWKIVGKVLLILCLAFGIGGWCLSPARSSPVKTYVGSASCAECHEEEYQKFEKYSKKARSFESVNKMQKGLTREEVQTCFECHTTGYGKSGGFVSEEQTPQLKNAGRSFASHC